MVWILKLRRFWLNLVMVLPLVMRLQNLTPAFLLPYPSVSSLRRAQRLE